MEATLGNEHDFQNMNSVLTTRYAHVPMMKNGALLGVDVGNGIPRQSTLMKFTIVRTTGVLCRVHRADAMWKGPVGSEVDLAPVC